MALQSAVLVDNGKAVGGYIPDTASAIGYKEDLNGTCANPNGYTAGSYFMAKNNGYMYKALAAITYGDSFTIGTNCEQTTVSAELGEIKSSLNDKEDKLGSVSITCLATDTYSEAFNKLFAVIDFSKVSYKTVMTIGGTAFYHLLDTDGSSYVRFSYSSISGANNGVLGMMLLKSSASEFKQCNGVITNASDLSSTVVGSARTFTIYYN